MNTNQPNKFMRFIRNNTAVILLVFCVLAITAVVLAVSLSKSPVDTPVDAPTPDDDTPVIIDPTLDNQPTTPTIVTQKVYYTSPVAYQSVGMEFTNQSDLLFVFNQTLNKWETHKGVDLIATENTPVNAMFDGTVLDVGETYGMGCYVVVDHGENVIATYSSLADVQVVKGQAVKQGEALGKTSTTASYEFSDGAHLHLEISVNGNQVDPMPYVNGEMYQEITTTVQN